MKKTYCLFAILFLLLSTSKTLQGQVEISPNPTMSLGQSPNSLGGINLCTGYSNYQGASSADYFREPQFGSGTGVPNNYYGWQPDILGDSSYIGLIAYNHNLLPSAVKCQLTQPIVPGHFYQVSFLVSLANESNYACAGLGYSFNLFTSNPNPILFPIIMDTANWVSFVDTVWATQASNYIWFGQTNSNPTMIQTVPMGNHGIDMAYYYFGLCSVIDLSIMAGVDDLGQDRKDNLVGVTSITGSPVAFDYKGLRIERWENSHGVPCFKKTFNY